MRKYRSIYIHSDGLTPLRNIYKIAESAVQQIEKKAEKQGLCVPDGIADKGEDAPVRIDISIELRHALH